MDRLTSLTVFVQVVDSGGFSAAARRLNMSTTMVSNHVQSLEDRLGVRLLNRTTRKVSPTEIGRVYHERCTQILAELEEADQAAGALQSAPRGTLRLYTSAHIVRFIAPVVAEFLALYPEASVELQMGERAIDIVEEGFDLAIRAALPSDSSLIVRRLADWRHVLCCAPAYLEAHAPPAHPEELRQHNCLRYAFYPFDDGWHFTGPDGKDIAVKVSGDLVTGSVEIMRAVALAGQGLYLSPGFFMSDDIEAGRLVPIMTEYRPVEFTMNAIYPHRRHLSAKVRGFIDLLVQWIAAHGLSPESDAR